MTDPIAAANTGTTPIRHGYEIDQTALERWMVEKVEGYRGPLSVEQFKGGLSNPTYRLRTPERDYVLRKKPPGELVKGAHAVEREARVMAALGPTGFPVPTIYGICTDESIIGTWFFVMEMMDGRILWDATLPDVPRSDRADHVMAISATMAALHNVDYTAAGLADYGKPGNYFARQIGRWSSQYLADELAGRNADMDRLVEWLPGNIPEGDETTLVHGDLRIDNMVFDPANPRVIAVLDWELSTLGHPLADFAYSALVYRMPPDIVAGLLGADLDALGIPSEQEFVADYCRRTGREDIPGWDFYIAFQFFRLAAIFHGIKGRVLRGTASNVTSRKRAEAFPRLARLGVEAMERC